MYFVKFVKFSLIIFFISCLVVCFPSFAESGKTFNNSIYQGYVTNKNHELLKLKLSKIDDNYLDTIEQNLENNSYVPTLNLKVSAESISDYLLDLDGDNIFIPQATKFHGHISEIIKAKSFDRKGSYKITFDEVICPSGEVLYLKSNLLTRLAGKTYNPVHHFGKSALSLVGGSLGGALVSYGLGGAALITATHGYSLGIGALTGGLTGVIGGVGAKGEDVAVEPGDELVIVPLDEINLSDLKQITCSRAQVKEQIDLQQAKFNLQVQSIKEKKDLLGEASFVIDIQFTNNSNESYRLNNFYLKDSQGKEYTLSFLNTDEDIFSNFPPNETRTAKLEFFIDHPKASHYLVLKDKNFNKEIGKWRLDLGVQ